jgi:inositol transport system substrate-binding protein
MEQKYMDACGVQNLFYETKLAIDAILDMQAGKKPESCCSTRALRSPRRT